jgi:hypothetical protein
MHVWLGKMRLLGQLSQKVSGSREPRGAKKELPSLCLCRASVMGWPLVGTQLFPSLEEKEASEPMAKQNLTKS